MGTFVVGLLIFGLVFLIGASEVLDATEKGLDFDQTKIEIDDKKLYESGRHFIGLTHNFIRFESNL